MFPVRTNPRRRIGDADRGDAPFIARCEDLWLLASGPGLILLAVAGADRRAAHRRAGEAAERLRQELFEHLTVAPFVDPMVLVCDDEPPAASEVTARMVPDLLLPGPVHPEVWRVGALIDGGCLSLAWRRHEGALMAG